MRTEWNECIFLTNQHIIFTHQALKLLRVLVLVARVLWKKRKKTTMQARLENSPGHLSWANQSIKHVCCARTPVKLVGTASISYEKLMWQVIITRRRRRNTRSNSSMLENENLMSWASSPLVSLDFWKSLVDTLRPCSELAVSQLQIVSWIESSNYISSLNISWKLLETVTNRLVWLANFL